MIKIDITKIENWDTIVHKHNEYVEENVLPKVKERVNECNDISYLFTGKNIYERVADTLSETEEDNEVKSELKKIVFGKKSDWNKFIKRYEEILSSEKNKVIKSIRLSRKYGVSLRKELIELLKEDPKQVKKMEKFKFSNRRLRIDEKEKLINNLYEEKDNIFNELEQIFNYDDFSKSSGWCRDEILTLIGIEVCPYCNRQYITYFKKNHKNRTTADLDHYYAQSRYPFLALSLYNFIPSCPICNRNFKGKSDKELIYPYEESFDDEDLNIKFITEPTNKDNQFEYLLGKDRKFEIKLSEPDGEKSNEKVIRANNNKEVFNLQEIYNSHRGYVQELAIKVSTDKEEWINDVIKNFGDKLCMDKEKAIELYFGNYLNVDNFNKKPLAKLTKDILDELQFKLL